MSTARCWLVSSVALAAFVALCALAPVEPARADAILPPPSDCPRGSRPMSSHAGQWCEDTTCATAADCEAGEECRAISLCVPPGTTATGPGGYDTPRGFTVAAGRPVSGACSARRACDPETETTCERARRCARPRHTIGPGVEEDAGGQTLRRATSAAALALVALGIVVVGRPRRKQSTERD